MFYTYAHYKPNNSLFYIGKGQRRRAFSFTYRNKHYSNIVAKHGEPKVEILANWETEAEAFEHEKFLIACFNDLKFKLANKTTGGEGASGTVVSQETRLKMSIANSSRKRTPEECRNISLAIKGKPRENARKPKSAEHKMRISIAMRGRKRPEFSAEWRANMSVALKKRHAERKQLKGD